MSKRNGLSKMEVDEQFSFLIYEDVKKAGAPLGAIKLCKYCPLISNVIITQLVESAIKPFYSTLVAH